MSARNGDKARFQKNRKRRLFHRAQIRTLVAGLAVKSPDEASGGTKRRAAVTPKG